MLRLEWPITLAVSLTFGSIAVLWPSTVYAQKTNQAVYEDPFDIGGGGASLTRASKEGRLYANPALLPYGGKFHRWLGQTISILVNKQSVNTARQLIASSTGESSQEESEQTAGNIEFVDAAFRAPIRAGWSLATSWVTSHYGISVFSRFEPDIRARDPGEFGPPDLTFMAESYHGAAFGVATRLPFRWLSLGATAKYIYASEPNLRVNITDQEQIAGFRDPSFLQDLTSHNVGIGVDVGMLMFFQGRHLDFSIAGKVDDVGHTKLNGPANNPQEFKQVTSAGVGLALHTGGDAIHFSLDYRDIQDVYEEEMFKKVYAGTKIMLRSYVGLAAGYYHGYPSYGAEIDLILMRVAATYYTRELGDHPGADKRDIYKASLSFGF